LAFRGWNFFCILSLNRLCECVDLYFRFLFEENWNSTIAKCLLFTAGYYLDSDLGRRPLCYGLGMPSLAFGGGFPAVRTLGLWR
jgi:hypothetical protein